VNLRVAPNVNAPEPIRLNPDPTAWMEQAKCRNLPLDEVDEFFFGDGPGGIQNAKRVCRLCPVRVQCADYALTNKHYEGVWGGMSHYERKGLCA